MCRATTDLVISLLLSSSREQTYVREFTPAIYTKHTWLSGDAERNAELGLLINHIIITAPTLP